MAVINDDDALRILKPIAEGVNPFTGEVIHSESLFESADVSRALGLAVKSLSRTSAATERKKNLPARAGASWDRDEDELLICLSRAGALERDLARIFDRTRGAIQSRLARLGVELVGGKQAGCYPKNEEVKTTECQ